MNDAQIAFFEEYEALLQKHGVTMEVEYVVTDNSDTNFTMEEKLVFHFPDETFVAQSV